MDRLGWTPGKVTRVVAEPVRLVALEDEKSLILFAFVFFFGVGVGNNLNVMIEAAELDVINPHGLIFSVYQLPDDV